MKAAKAMMPDVPAYWLCDKRLLVSYDRSLAEQAKAGGVDGLDVHWSGVTRRFIRAVKAAGLRLYVWTVDDPAQALRLKAMGADGITTNRPGLEINRVSKTMAGPEITKKEQGGNRTVTRGTDSSGMVARQQSAGIRQLRADDRELNAGNRELKTDH